MGNPLVRAQIESRASRVAAALLLFSVPGLIGQNWTSIGPGQMSGSDAATGRINAVAVHPANPRHWILGSASGGVWESRDEGGSWKALTDSQPTLAIGSVAFAASNPSILYAATGEASYSVSAQAGRGILKSTDGGVNWRLLGSAEFGRAGVGVIRVDPRNPNRVVATMARSYSGRNNEAFLWPAAPPPFGIQRSTNGGETWTQTLIGESTALEADPTNFDNLYASIGLPAGYGAYQPAVNGVHRSTDGGQTWRRIDGPWGLSGFGTIALALAPSNRNVLYASVEGGNGRLAGLYRTDNAWDPSPQWIRIPTSGNWSTTRCFNCPDYCGINCQQRYTLAVDPADPDTLYAGGATLWRCDECRASSARWMLVSLDIRGGWGIPSRVRTLAWAGNRMIAGTDGGVFSTTTRNGPWRSDNRGLHVVRMIGGALHPTEPGFAVAATADTGAIFWNGSPEWLPLRPGGAGEIAISSSQPTRDVMSVVDSQIQRATDGRTFARADNGFDPGGFDGSYLPVRKCPSRDDVFLAGGVRLFRSDNFFSSSETPTWRANSPPGARIRSIAFAASDQTCGTYAYGTASGEIRLTTDGGNTWKDVDAARTLPGRSVNSLAFDPTNGTIVYAAFSSLDEATPGKAGHLFKSTTALTAAPGWTNITPATANVPFNVVALDPASPASVYAGTDTAVWRSTDGGAAWQFLGPAAGLPNVPVHDLQFGTAPRRVVAFTYGRGAFELRLTTGAGTPPPAITSREEIPVTSGAEFSFRLSAEGQGPWTWTVTAGELPPGLALSASGELTGRVSEPGEYTFTIEVRDASGRAASKTFRLTAGPPDSLPVWTGIGPSPLPNPFVQNQGYGGRVAALAVDPADENRWLTGFGNGGLWESRDAGSSWNPIARDAPTPSIGALAFAPSDTAVVYAATGETTLGGITKAGLGMLRSRDGGAAWGLTGAAHLARASVRRIRVHPTDPNTLLAATARGGHGRDQREGVHGQPPTGILKSTDGGATWTRTLPGQATSLEADPNNFANQYAAIGDQRGPRGVNDDSLDAVPNGVYRSNDGGQTWKLIEGPWGPSTLERASVGRIELAIAPSDPNVVYASFQVPPNGGSNATGHLGLFRTSNAWDPVPDWVRISTEPLGPDSYCGPTKCGYSHILSVSPADPDTLFAGGAVKGLWRCTQCGSAPVWTNTHRNLPVHGDHHAVAWTGGRMILGTDGGVYSTSDLGATWRNHNTGLATMIMGAALHPTDPEVMLGGLRDNGAALRTPDGTWKPIGGVLGPNFEVGEAETVISNSRPDTHWMGAWIWGDIARTVDGGLTWTRTENGLDKTGAAGVAPVRMCPANDDVFLTGTNRLWRTDSFFGPDEPQWIPNSPVHPYPFPFAGGAPGTILSIAYVESDKSCNSYAYGNRGGQIFLTRDGGATWTDLDPGRTLPERPVNSVVFDPSDPNIAWVALSSFDSATPGCRGHVFKTTNALSRFPRWVNAGPTQDQPFNVVTVEPQDPRIVYAGSDTALWRSNDGGAVWQRMGLEQGMPVASIYDIKTNAATGRTVVFTYGHGAFFLGPQLVAASQTMAPGETAQVRGINLAGYTRGATPADRKKVVVKVNGIEARVTHISPGAVSFVMPPEVRGAVRIQLFRDGVGSNVLQGIAGRPLAALR